MRAISMILTWLCVLGSVGGCRSSPAQGNSDDPQAAPACRLIEDDPGPAGTDELSVETVASGLEIPWGIAFLPDGGLLVTERPGRVRVVRGGRLLAEPVATVDALHRGEGGLLGIALHPAFPDPPWFYLYVTSARDGRSVNRVERWRLSADGRQATRDRVILDDIPAARFHNGGRLRIGPDRMLYIATGDAGEPSSAQDRGTLAGAILRLTLDGGVPADNPWPGNPAFIIGIRNPQAFDWRDAETLVIADHGPSGELGRSGHDEVSIARAGANLGWPDIYGCRTQAGMVTPAIAWRRAVPPGGAALVGRGTELEGWEGNLVMATLGSRHLHRVVFDRERPERVARHEVYLKNGYGRLREAVIGPDGALYVTTSNCDGRGDCPPGRDRILRITRQQ